MAETTNTGRVLLAGSTGLVGGRCLELLLASPDWKEVGALARRPLGRADARLRPIVVAEMTRLDEVPTVPADVALCALGTTIRKAGSEEAFAAVDRDAVAAFAWWARRGGARTFVMVSSVGAAVNAGTFYLRIKGEAEEAVAKLDFPRFVALRPSLLLGPRAERRPAEAAFQKIAPLLSPLLQGPLRRYRAMPVEAVARAMLAAAADPTPGRFVWEHDRIAPHGKA